MTSQEIKKPFCNFAPLLAEPTPLRAAITAAYRRAEEDCLPPLLEAASFDEMAKAEIKKTATHLIELLRAKHRGTGVEGLVQEYALSSQEGVALMCLAEALLRIPDQATRDALIRDKVAGGDWKAHLGSGKSLFVNAATWGLVITGKLTSTVSSGGLSAALTRLIARCGEPVIRKAVDMAMRMMGEQFVRGETIEEAVKRAQPLEQRGFRYSYDMLGEAAITADDAARYWRDYEHAIHVIGQVEQRGGMLQEEENLYQRPGISIKLSALHPRYSRAQADRVMTELLPRVKQLVLLAKRYNIGLNIDAEEADRLELSLDILEALCFDPDFEGFDGIGFVVQAYGRRCSFVLDYIIDLARRSNHRLMVRLVKGAYWDAEIKRAQVEGLESYPVFTRKVYTDVSYIANAAKLLAAPDAVFPQFATHNAQTLATIYHMAGPAHYHEGQYEFQCLHGMGEPLYDEVVGADKMGRSARIYAPVGTHETLLAYLVRRLLENGANSSFINQIGDKTIGIEHMVADPVDVVRAQASIGAPHDKIPAPADLFGERRLNSRGYDLSDENVLTALSTAFKESSEHFYCAPLDAKPAEGVGRLVRNPADHEDVVGQVFEIEVDEAVSMVRQAAQAAISWAQVSVDARATCLDKAADLMQKRMPALMALVAREAGKSIPNAIAELREAIDFLRFYASEARAGFGPMHKPLGPIICISPWNFPLAIFIGQVAAALVAGNPVLAKPAEETPLIAAQAVGILHEVGVPRDVLQLVLGDGAIGAALVAAEPVSGVMFTGSTEVARLIQKQLAPRLGLNGKPIPFIAETGGQNAMIVDSSALAEQVVFDVIASAFDSAGQRCSALRVLCLQDDIAARTLAMLKGALQELRLGRTDFIGVDVGPVINLEAKQNIESHIEEMRRLGYKVEQLPLDSTLAKGTFIPPTIIELPELSALKREVFGPVLHIIRYRREELDQLIEAINGTGYGLTFGIHTRLDETISYVTSRISAGNIYVNRNIIGAVVGSQPFGGRGLSGTGPKAGGPLYLGRLVDVAPTPELLEAVHQEQALSDFIRWLEEKGMGSEAEFARQMGEQSLLGLEVALPGPVGEDNLYALHARGTILLFPQTVRGLYRQVACALATGNTMVIDAESGLQTSLQEAPRSVQVRLELGGVKDASAAGCLIEGDAAKLIDIQMRLAEERGPILLTQGVDTETLIGSDMPYNLAYLLEEMSVSVNTAAAGGNASLMTID